MLVVAAGGLWLWLWLCSLVTIVDAMARDGCMHQCGGSNGGPIDDNAGREEGWGVEHTQNDLSIFIKRAWRRITHLSTGAAARCVV